MFGNFDLLPLKFCEHRKVTESCGTTLHRMLNNRTPSLSYAALYFHVSGYR
jgi:hypothetical protein